MIRLQILSVLMPWHSPNNTRCSLKLKLCAWVQRRFNKLDSSFQNLVTFWQDQSKCCMVSLWALQNSHKSFCSLLNLDTDLFVVNIPCKILNWNQRSFVSVVDVFKVINVCFHWFCVIPVNVCHFVSTFFYPVFL